MSSRQNLKEKWGEAKFILEQMSEHMKTADVASITDLISIYIQHSKKYKNQTQFADAIGTTRQTLHRMLSHSDKVSTKVFFNSIEMIHQDANIDELFSANLSQRKY